MPCSSPFAPWINEIAARGVTGGCGGGNFCPIDEVARQQMAVFLVEDVRPRAVRPLGFRISIGSHAGAASAAPVFFGRERYVTRSVSPSDHWWYCSVTEATSPSRTRRPWCSQIARSQLSRICAREWETSIIVLPRS